MSSHILHLAALVAVATLSACSTEPGAGAGRLADNRAWWTGDGVEGSPRIVIDLSEQRLRYFKGDKLVGVSPISSGREGNSTLNGKFRIMDKDLDHRSSLYGSYVDAADSIVVEDVDTRSDPRPPGTRFVGASMRYFMRIVGGIGMHEGYLPGYPASHGCIRLPTRMAAIFFECTPIGTPVEVIGNGRLAASEEAIPIGHDSLPVLSKPLEQGRESKPSVPTLAETARSVAANSRKSKPGTSFIRFSKRPKPGTTLFLEE